MTVLLVSACGGGAGRFAGLRVELEKSPTETYDALTQQVVADMAAGKGHDVVMVGLGQTRFWVDKYKPLPIDVSALKPTYDKRYLEAGTVEGKPYVVPFQVSMPVMFTNTTMTSDNGVPETPANASELTQAAREVTKSTGAPSVSIPQDGIADWVAQAFIQSAGATFVNPDGSAGFDTEAGRRGLAVYSDLGRENLLRRLSFEDGLAEFAKGDLAYLITSPSQSASMREKVGGKFEWTVNDVPVSDGGTPSMPAGGNGWTVLSQDPCKAAFANEMIGAMLDPAVIEASAKKYSYAPVDTEAARRLATDPDANTQLGYAWTFDGSLTPWGGWHGDSTPKVNQIVTHLVQKLSSGQPLGEALPDSVRQINEVATGE